MTPQQLDSYVSHLTKPEPESQLTTYQLLPNAPAFIKDFIAEIEQAHTAIAAQFYTFEADNTGLPVAKALLGAAKRGVHVQLMIDHYIDLSHNDVLINLPGNNHGSRYAARREWRATHDLIAHLRAHGVDVKMINPLGFLHHKMLRRDHKKLVAIDTHGSSGGIAYIGGTNISDHNAAWHDYMVRVQGPAGGLIHNELEATWHGQSQGTIRPYPGGLFLADQRRQPVILPFIQRLIETAKQKIYIESPYLWGRDITSALCRAAGRGTNVHLIVPSNNNHRLFAPSPRLLTTLAQSGAQIHRYVQNGGMTHAKVLLVDNVCVVGSHNFNAFLSGKMSEACLATSDPGLINQIKDFLSADIRKSVPNR